MKRLLLALVMVSGFVYADYTSCYSCGVVYDGYTCPIDDLEDEIDDLEDEIEDLEDEIQQIRGPILKKWSY